MALINRDKDASEQKTEFSVNLQNTVAAATYLLWQAPYPCEVRQLTQAASGLSGAPFHFIDVYRFVVGAGATTITGLHASVAVTAVGTSGVQGFSVLAPSSSSLIVLQAKDCLVLRTAVANTAVAQVQVSGIVKKLEDILSTYGSQT